MDETLLKKILELKQKEAEDNSMYDELLNARDAKLYDDAGFPISAHIAKSGTDVPYSDEALEAEKNKWYSGTNFGGKSPPIIPERPARFSKLLKK